MTNQLAVRAAHVRATSKRRRHRLRAVPIERHHASEAATLHEPARAARSRSTDVLVRMLRSIATRTDAD
jgi:hypothetical protein